MVILFPAPATWVDITLPGIAMPAGLHATVSMNRYPISRLELNLLIGRDLLLNVRLVDAPGLGISVDGVLNRSVRTLGVRCPLVLIFVCNGDEQQGGQNCDDRESYCLLSC